MLNWIKTIRQLIYWLYSKLIAEASNFKRNDFAIIMNIYKKLNSGELNISSLYRENLKLLASEKKCVYCGSLVKIELDHIIPKNKGGTDNIDNIIYSCKKCNISKSDKDLIEWYGPNYSAIIPRQVFIKYLKIIYEEFDKNLLLDLELKNFNPEIRTSDLSKIFLKENIFLSLKNNQ